jgi:hypothetical protein
MMHVNYSARLASIKSLPEIYLVEGKAAPGQLAVFGSEPGEKTYSPLWAETILTWKVKAYNQVAGSRCRTSISSGNLVAWLLERLRLEPGQHGVCDLAPAAVECQ